jgi:phosphate starvation-inducible PhoH-like protein
MATSTPTTTVVVPGTHVMTALVGPRDHNLRQIEQRFPSARISVRGNEVRISGDDAADVVTVSNLFEELSTLLQAGQQLDDVTLERVMTMVGASERPSEILGHQVLRGAKGRQVKPKTAGQKRYIDTIAENVITFGLGPAGTGKTTALAPAVAQLRADGRAVFGVAPSATAAFRRGRAPPCRTRSKPWATPCRPAWARPGRP